MADRSHLTPVRTTDKNGRGTTVYRKEAAAAAAAGKARVPAPSSPTPPGELRAPKPLPTAELEELASNLARGTLYSVDDFHAMIVAEPKGRWAAALAAEGVADGTLTPADTRDIFIHAVRQCAAANRAQGGLPPKAGALFARDLLLLAARVAPRIPNRRYPRWTTDLIGAAEGARFPRGDRLDTVADLDSLAAVVAFILRDRPAGNFTYEAHAFGIGTFRSIESGGLEALLRERPRDLDRILHYLDERSIRSMDSTEDVADLRQWLDTTDDTPSLGGGWL